MSVTELEDILKNYAQSGTLPMHMPGHKRALPPDNLPWDIDITEISGFDNLHGAQGMLKSAMERAARVFGAYRSFFLVNGSTAGVLAGICAATRRGETVIMARGCHKSVYNAVELRGLTPQFITARQLGFGAYAGVGAAEVKKALCAHKNAKLLIITSPTYEGAVSELGAIVAAAHEAGVAVLVDSAHGAHFGFSPLFPESAVSSGADIVVHGLHKTLPSLTQTALLHYRPGLVDEGELERQLSVFQTSSPSYPLMASIDHCVSLLEERGTELFRDYAEALKAFDESAKALSHLAVFCHGSDSVKNYPELFGFDLGKIVILTSATDMTGPELLTRLRDEYKIELEMAMGGYALAMTSICDTKETLKRLAGALIEIDSTLKVRRSRAFPALPPIPQRKMTSDEARYLPGKRIKAENAEGRVSGCALWAYPPGIPLIIPGEIVSGALIAFLNSLSATGVVIQGEKGTGKDSIYVLDD